MLRVSLLDVNQSYNLHNSVLTTASVTLIQIFFSKEYIGTISEKIEFKFSRAVVDIINISQKEKRT